MLTLWNEHPLLVVIAAVVVVALLWLLLRPRQRISLSDNVPLRPHMAAAARHDSIEPGAPQIDLLATALQQGLPGADGPPDDLKLLKGVGPKMASLLQEHGITRFDQIAKLSGSQVDALDTSMGAFRGRFARDRIVEQAHYLARGDRDGFEQQFGKL